MEKKLVEIRGGAVKNTLWYYILFLESKYYLLVGSEQGQKINIVLRFMVFDLDHAVTIHNPSCYQTMNLMLCLYSRSGSVFLDMEVATMI